MCVQCVCVCVCAVCTVGVLLQTVAVLEAVVSVRNAETLQLRQTDNVQHQLRPNT